MSHSTKKQLLKSEPPKGKLVDEDDNSEETIKAINEYKGDLLDGTETIELNEDGNGPSLLTE